MTATADTSDTAAADTRPLWGVGQYDDGTRRVPWEVSHAEIDREMGGAMATLGALGLAGGARVLWCSVLSEAAHLWPLFIGTMLGHGQFSLADATRADALRVGMFVRRLEYRAVMGLNDAVLDGFDDLGRDPADVFGSVPILGARPGAYERLEAAGLRPSWFVLCGPAVAIGTEPGGPARVDAGEWRLSESGGRIHVTGLRPRATTFDQTPTAILGSLVDETTFFPETGADQ